MSAPATATAEYLAYLRVERRASAHTLDAYQRDLAALLAWMQDQRLSSLDALRPDDIRSFIANEHRRGLAGRSLQRRLSALRGLFRYRRQRGHVEHDPTTGLRAPKAPRKLPQVLDADEMTRLVEVPTDVTLGVRDRALLELLYSSGLRVSELCNLHWRDLDLNDRLVTVIGKGNKQRAVPIGRHALEALQAWRKEQSATHDSPVFPGRGGKPISPRAVQIRLRQLALQQGIWKRVHPHLIRHSFASHVLESSGDLRGVQELLGHADISTTQIYTHLDFQHLAKVYDAAHPRAKRRS